MIDARLRPLIDPPLNAAGRWLAARGVSANAVTLVGLIIGLAGAACIVQGLFGWALALVIASRLLDGTDGAVARAGNQGPGKARFGGYLDIVADFIFYAAVPLAFGLADPANLVPALVLTAAITATGVSFLAFAVAAAQSGATTAAHGEKSFFYSNGLAEGAETIAFFLAMCAFPAAFAVLAYIFAGLCAATVVQRSLLARATFR